MIDNHAMQPEGYNFIPIDGKVVAIERSSGEVFDTATVIVPIGTRIHTPAQQRAYQAWKERENRRSCHFFFASSENNYSDISASSMAKLMYLATYMSYGGRLMQTGRKMMKKTDLQQVLRLSKKAVYGFWNDVSGKYIFQEENGELFMNADFFQRGKLSLGPVYQKFYNQAVQDIYQRARPSQHKKLGAVFQMLKYVNVEYNVLCHNPLEDDLSKIEFMTLDEFCDAIGYDKSNRHRLPKEYAEITLAVEERNPKTLEAGPIRQERFCSFVTDGADISTAKVYINPRVMYRGHNWSTVEILGEFCRS